MSAETPPVTQKSYGQLYRLIHSGETNPFVKADAAIQLSKLGFTAATLGLYTHVVQIVAEVIDPSAPNDNLTRTETAQQLNTLARGQNKTGGLTDNPQLADYVTTELLRLANSLLEPPKNGRKRNGNNGSGIPPEDNFTDLQVMVREYRKTHTPAFNDHQDQLAIFQNTSARDEDVHATAYLNLSALKGLTSSAQEWFSQHTGRPNDFLKTTAALKPATTGGKIGLITGSTLINPLLGAGIGMGFYGYDVAQKLHHAIKEKGATNTTEALTALKDVAVENWRFLWTGESQKDREAKILGMIVGISMIAVPTLIAKALP